MKSILTIILACSVGVSLAQTRKTGDYHLDQNYKVAAKGLIKLTCSDAQVSITGSDRTDVNVKIDREVEIKGFYSGTDEFSVDIDEAGGNITIRERQNTAHFGIVGTYNERYTIKIQAPRGVSLVITGDDGDYTIESINGTIDADLDDADIELTNCNGDDFRFNVDDGDVKMDKGRGSLEIDGDDSNVDIRNAAFTKIDANMDDGDFMIETSLSENGDYFIDAQDGKIMFTVTGGGGRFDIRHGDGSVRADATFSAVEESEDRSRYTLANGNARIDIRADDASVRLASR